MKEGARESRASLRLAARAPALPRRTGKVAPEAQLRARLEMAKMLTDVPEERSAARELAMRIASRDTEMDVAVELAFRALGDQDDRELRHTLAAWLEGLGEPGLAASELRKLVADTADASTAALLVRIGVLHARAGDAAGAQEALTEASQADEADALSLELLGALAAWGASESVTKRAGSEAYVRAARRRAASRDADGEIEDLRRAFELDPASPLAAAALVGAYTVREKPAAADEVLRAHAAALHADGAPQEAQDVHARRRVSAALSGDLARALGAALDEGLDTKLEGDGADAFDDLLARASAFEPLAVRLEARAERAQRRPASARWAELGRLLSGPLAAPDRAAVAYAHAVAADATNTDALHALRALTQKSRDPSWLFEGLVRSAMGGEAFGGNPDSGARGAGARALASAAEEHGHSVLAAWAYGTLATLDANNERSRAAAARLADVVKQRDEELVRARRGVEDAKDKGRIEALAEVARLLRYAPDRSEDLAQTLLEIAKTRPDDDVIVAEAVRVAERVNDWDGIAKLARAGLDAKPSNIRMRNILVSALRRKGDLGAAAEAAKPLADDQATRWTCSVAWTTAAIGGATATRGHAIAAVAPTVGSRAAATFAAIAAEELARSGEIEAARRAAQAACRSDPESPRALLVMASLSATAEGRVAQAALERALEVAGPSYVLANRLADLLEQLGDARAAVAWAQRAVSLRPGDPQAAEAFVDRAVRAKEPEALAEALAWLVPQPQPSKDAAPRISRALTALGSRDPAKAAQLSRRVLDLLGPRHAKVRAAIEEIASAAGDLELRVKLAERWVAAGAPAQERGQALTALAAHYETTGDVERELRAFLRAAREGADLTAFAARIEALGNVEKDPDAEIAWLEVRAELRLDEGRNVDAAHAFRELGAALWDMADDRTLAVSAWLRAAHCDSKAGYATLRHDLTAFADPQYAADCLVELVDREADRGRSAIIAMEAARAALDLGSYPRALGLAKTALERDPARAEALETAEHASKQLARVPDMSPVYDQVARRSLGRFGRRAAHHRAARYFEASGAAMLALKHAAQAFIAVPSEGTTLALLQRTAEKAQRQSVAVRTVEHVSELARGPGARAAWLLRAANMTSRDIEGIRQKVDLLIKAAVLAAAPATLGMLAVAAREVISMAPDDIEALAMRLERASESLAKKLEGPDGARMAIKFSEVAVDLFSDAAWGWRCLERAIESDADVDEYVRLIPFAQAFARADDAEKALARVMAAVEKPYSNVGHALMRLVGAIAHAAGDAAKRARALVMAAEKEQDDDEIVAEADAAVSVHPDRGLLERLSRKVGVFRRSEALRAIAKKHVAAGLHDQAVAALERAHELAPDEEKSTVAKELAEALVAAGRGEDAALRELALPNLTPDERAERWARLAKVREENGDKSGAADALLQAAMEKPSVDRWNAVERAAEASGRDHIRVEALGHLAKLVSVTERLTVMKRLARAEGARGSLAAAETAWRDVLAASPTDEEADIAIEALLVARGSYDELAEHLAHRADRLGRDPEKLRAVRLRRAAILEQRLGRLEDACTELERVLTENPGHVSAQRWLADLYERIGEPGRAIPVLEQLYKNTNEELEFVSIGVRRARALLAAGDLGAAQRALAELHVRVPNALAVIETRVEIARAAQEPRELGEALEALAKASADDPRVRSEFLVEAAQAAARAGDTDASLARAREAARLSPDVASTQLFARGLEYRVRGAGTVPEAKETVASLERLDVASGLEAEDIALRAFLLAEAEDVCKGPGAGERTLRKCLADVGPQALVALGLAERAATAGRHDEAYRFYIEAVYGNLLGLRRPGRVALAAAESAAKADDQDTLQRFLNEAAKDPETRVDALRRLAQASIAVRDFSRAKNVLRGLADGATGYERAEVLADLARALFASENPADRIEADRTMREAADLAPAPLSSSLKAELDTFRKRLPVPSKPPATETASAPAPKAEAILPQIPSAPPVLIANAPSTPPEEPLVSVRHPPLGEAPKAPPPSITPVEEAKKKHAAGDHEGAEKMLGELLGAGSLDAADALDEILAKDPARREALLKVRRQAVELVPGDTERLHALREAARIDQNPNYVRAIEHVLRAFDAERGELPPPPLSAQNGQPGILSLLTRHSHEPAGQALGVIWEGAAPLFAKPPTAYGMSGLERVVPGPMSPLTRLYEAALRLLDTPRFALFHRRGPKEGEKLELTVALLNAPSAIVSGEAREDSRELRWMLGRALSAVLSENALALGLPADEAQSLWQVVVAAFGPPGRAALEKKHAQLAETLWQTLAPRAQRRLKELLAQGEPAPFEVVVDRALQSGRRVGMFLTGDFAHAARTVVIENGKDPIMLGKPGGLVSLCREIPALADLYRLALRPEYADARWHVPTPAAQRLAAGKLPPV